MEPLENTSISYFLVRFRGKDTTTGNWGGIEPGLTGRLFDWYNRYEAIHIPGILENV